jgi:NADH-quinone oxidoreductase subunit C
MEEATRSPAEQLVERVNSVCAGLVTAAAIECGDVVLSVSTTNISQVLKQCKQSAELDFSMLIDITAVDWMDARPERFEVVYQLLSISKRTRVTIKVALSEDKPEIPSATALWNGANFLEREVWDMFGIRFVGHPDLRRILMYEEFVGHPLRKDYPVQGKQPRIPLRYPEVENTARKMHRGDLVTIRTRPKGENSPGQTSDQGRGA